MDQFPLGVVYFIQAPINGLVKIGHTLDHPDIRLAHLRTFSPVDLVPLGVLPGTMSEEKDIHARLAGARRHGEWFEPTESVMEFIRLHAAPWPAPGGSMPVSADTPGWRRSRGITPKQAPDPGVRGLFRQKYSGPGRERLESSKWYGQYRDAEGIVRRVPLDPDREVAAAMLSKLKEGARKRLVRKLTRID